MVILDLHLVACDHALAVVFERTAIQRDLGALRPSNHAQGAGAVISIIFKRAVIKRCIHRNSTAPDGHRRRRGFVDFISLINLERIVLGAFPTADVHVREVGRLPCTHGSIKGNRPIGLFSGGLCNELEVFHGKVEAFARIRLIDATVCPVIVTVTQKRFSIAADLGRGARITDELDITALKYKEGVLRIRKVALDGQRTAQRRAVGEI